MTSEQEIYDELAFYTLQHGESRFIHQHIVDAYAAQTADEQMKPIKLTFALLGLYLYLEKDFTGRDVQLAHMDIAKKHNPWPEYTFPEQRGAMRVADVVAVPAGHARDDAIRQWCVSVWEAWVEVGARELIIDFLPAKYK